MPATELIRKNILNRFFLTFKDLNLESKYRQNFSTHLLHRARHSIIITLFLFIFYNMMLFIFEYKKNEQNIDLQVCIGLIFIITYAASHIKYNFNHQQIFSVVTSLLITSSIIFFSLESFDGDDRFCYASINLCMIWIIFMMGLRFINSICVVTLIFISYNMLTISKTNNLEIILDNNFLVIANILICLSAAYSLEKGLRLQYLYGEITKKNSDELHSAVIESSPDTIISTDEFGTILDCNHPAEFLFSEKKINLIGKHLNDLISVNSDGNNSNIFSFSDKYYIFGAQQTLHLQIANIKSILAELTIKSISLIGKKIFIFYIRDITDKQLAELEIENQRNLLIKNERFNALSTMLAGVAHELNNPLTIIIGQIQLMLNKQMNSETLTRLKKIEAASHRCTNIVSNFLAVIRQEPQERKNIFINELIGDVMEIMDDNLKKDNIEVNLNLDNDAPPLFANATQLQQVITNIIINAQQAMYNAKIRKITVTTHFIAHESVIKITICDTGPGIPSHILSRIFDPFFTTKPCEFGNGLGLAVSKGIINSHNGTIEVVSEEELGSCFIIKLPPKENFPTTKINNIFDAQKSFTAKVIIVVDDDDEIRDLIFETLSHAGHRVFTAKNGAEGLSLIKTYQPDLIFSDIKMPTMNGIDFYSKSKEIWPNYADLFIFISGDTLNEEASNFLRNLKNKVIEKPFTPKDLLLATFVTMDKNNASTI